MDDLVCLGMSSQCTAAPRVGDLLRTAVLPITFGVTHAPGFGLQFHRFRSLPAVRQVRRGWLSLTILIGLRIGRGTFGARAGRAGYSVGHDAISLRCRQRLDALHFLDQSLGTYCMAAEHQVFLDRNLA